MLAILRDEENIASQILAIEGGVSYDVFKREVEINKNNFKDEAAGSTGGGNEDDYPEEESFSSPKKVSDIKSKTPVLDNFGIGMPF